MKSIVSFLISFLTIWFGLTVVAQASPPANFQTSLVIGSGLDGPSGFEFAPDGRIFILERTGKIKVYKNGQLLATPFAELPSIATGDRGLIGIAFDPDYQINHYVYFYYTGLDQLNRLVRYSSEGDVGTEGPVILYQTSFPSEWLHVGGSIRFGADGKIYFAVGDNGYPPNGQDLSNPHGKILRINKDGSVPTDNPFIGIPGVLPEIWAYGFRNPWRFQFDSKTSELYGGDVGDFTTEEVNHIMKGKNYGWPICEGECLNSSFINPIYSYPHDGASAAATGGPVYRANMFPSEYQGSLFFGDYAKGFIKRLTLDQNGNSTGVFDFDLSAGSVVDMKVASDGSFYYVTYYPGRLYRITYSTVSNMPVANAGSDKTKGVEPLAVQFTSAGSYDPDGDGLTYFWDFGDNTYSNQANPSKTYTQKGTYTVELRVSDGVNDAIAVSIVVQVGLPPDLTIATPVQGATYRAGDTISYTASAVDGAGFDIDDGAIKTEVLFHHDTHIHPFLGPVTGRTGSFIIPNQNHEPSANTWLEIIVSSTDTNGLSTTKSISIYPQKSIMTFLTSIPGLSVLLNGIPIVSGTVVEGVVGYIREISIVVTQQANGVVYAFNSWSDSGQAQHLITTPAEDTIYTANFEEAPVFSGKYFSNKDLLGAPVLTRLDNEINFEWGEGSPDPSIPADGFSVRWEKSQKFAFGRYKFITESDDGVRLFVDNQLVINEWKDQGRTKYSYTVDFLQGEHAIAMEYYENGGGAVAKLSWELTPDQPVAPTPTVTKSIYTDQLDSDWQDWSWGSIINLLSTNPVYAGSNSISFTPQTAWAGMRFHSLSGAQINSGFISFAAQSSGPGQKFAVLLFDQTNMVIGNPIELVDYGGDPILGIWKLYSIPLSAFPVTDKAIKDVVLQEWTGAAQTAVYIDEISFTNDVSPTSTPTPPPTPTPTPVLTNIYQGKYWNTPNSGSSPSIPTTPADLIREDSDINFTWNDDSPDPEINLDHFVVQWSKQDTFEDADYIFTTVSDDGIRVFVDNQIVLDQWNDHAATTYTAAKHITAGVHDIKVEFYENSGGAVAKFSFAKAITPLTYFKGEYFDNQMLSGSSKLTRPEANINFNWGDGSPDPIIPSDHFSVRFSKQQDFSAGVYDFVLQSDDGIRFFLDNQLIIDDWSDHPLRTYTPSVVVSSGTHTIKIEYYENGGGAVVTFVQK